MKSLDKHTNVMRMKHVIDQLQGLLNARFISDETAERRDKVLNDASEAFAANARELLDKGDVVGADVLLGDSLDACPCRRASAGPCARCVESSTLAAEIKARLPSPVQPELSSSASGKAPSRPRKH